MDFQEHVFIKVWKMHLSGASARKVCVNYFYEDMPLEVQQMEHVAKCDTYLDILFMVFIHVLKS